MNNWERLYNIGLHVALPFGVAGHYWAFSGRDPDRHTQQRFVDLDTQLSETDPQLWLHGASVGEMQLVRLVRDWAVSEGVDRDRILVTGQTLSGLGSIDHPTKALLPADYPGLLASLPTGDIPLIVLETEIWPNLYRQCSGRVHLFNGHLKPDSFQSYCRFKPLFRSALGHCGTIMTRGDQDTRRFRVLSPKQNRGNIRTTGDLKWTKLLENAADDSLDGPSFPGDRPVLVAGSTWAGEEEPVLKLADHHDMNIYLAPRHMDRLDGVRSLLEQSECSWRSWTGNSGTVNADVILVDTIGVLSELYRRADIVFVGGSWVEGVGGHDMLEPARFGVPIVSGPHLSNVSETAERLERAGMLSILRRQSDWDDQLTRCLDGNFTAEAEQGLSTLKDRARSIEQQYRDRLSEILNRECPS